MSTYKEIKGFKVQTLSADPVVAGTSWSSGGTMNTGRYNVGAAGTQTAALGYGGYAGSPVFGTTSPTSGSTDRTEAYDGSSWTEVGDLNQFRNHGISFGTQTAAVFSSGISDYAPGPPYGRTTYTETETWNGSAWTEVNNIPTVLYRIAAFGTSTAGITAAGAKNHPASDSSESYSWDGTNWTDGPNVNTPRSYQMGLGTSTAGMIVGGYIQSPASMIGNTEIWNGSAWTEVNDLNTARRSGGASKIGSTSEGIVFGGSTPPTTAKTEVYNGTSWSETADLATARVGMPGGVGTGSLALCFGGSTPASPDITGASEEFSVSTIADTNLDLGQVYYNSTANAFKVTKTVFGAGTWASGGNMITARAFGGSFGTQTAAVYASGYNGTQIANTESYNGSSWSEGNDVNTNRRETGSFGTQTAGIVCGGRPPNGLGVTESYNGTSFTEVNDMNTGRSDTQSNWGTQTSGVFATGYTTTGVTNAETWDGTSWTEVAEVNTAREYACGLGDSNTSGLCIGGSPQRNIVESWNGTSWSETTEINEGRGYSNSSGTATDGIIFAGPSDAPVANNAKLTEKWNGSSWTEVNDLSTGRYSPGGSKNGSTVAALAFAGVAPPYTAATEEFTAPSSIANQTIGSS